MKPLVIIGSGGLAKEIVWLIEENNRIKPEWEILGYISKDHIADTYKYPFLGDDDWLLNYKLPLYAVCAIGNPLLRYSITKKFAASENIIFPSIVSCHAVVPDSINIGSGTIICAGSIITVDICIGNHVICDRKTTIGHDSFIDDYVTISPGVNISGNVTINKYSMIGTGSNIIQGKIIGNRCIIGAGATIINDIPDNCTAVGVPAKIIKKNHE